MSGRRNQNRGRQGGQENIKQFSGGSSYGTGAGRSYGDFQYQNDERSDFQDIYSGSGENQSEARHQDRSQNDRDRYGSQSSRLLSAGGERPYGSWEGESEGRNYTPRNNSENQSYRSASDSYGMGSGQGRWGSQNSGQMRDFGGQSSGQSYPQQYNQNSNRGGSQWPNSSGSNAMGNRWSTESSSSNKSMGSTGRGPKGYQRSDDRIKEDICESLTDMNDIDASEIEVKVERGEVTLTGTVDSRMAKRSAEDAAEQVRGVKDITNQIRVQSGQEKPSAQTHTLKSQLGSSRPEAKQA